MSGPCPALDPVTEYDSINYVISIPWNDSLNLKFDYVSLVFDPIALINGRKQVTNSLSCLMAAITNLREWHGRWLPLSTLKEITCGALISQVLPHDLCTKFDGVTDCRNFVYVFVWAFLSNACIYLWAGPPHVGQPHIHRPLPGGQVTFQINFVP